MLFSSYGLRGSLIGSTVNIHANDSVQQVGLVTADQSDDSDSRPEFAASKAILCNQYLWLLCPSDSCVASRSIRFLQNIEKKREIIRYEEKPPSAATQNHVRVSCSSDFEPPADRTSMITGSMCEILMKWAHSCNTYNISNRLLIDVAWLGWSYQRHAFTPETRRMNTLVHGFCFSNPWTLPYTSRTR